MADSRETAGGATTQRVSVAHFHDNLYARCAPELRERGCGLFGLSKASGAFIYERHSEQCAPGRWRVAFTLPAEVRGAFFGVLGRGDASVMDDFGSLVRVPA